MKQKNLFLIYFITFFLLNTSSVSSLKLKLKQMFGELNDLKASGINLSDPSQVKDLAGLESMISNEANDKPPVNVIDKNEEEAVKNELLKETMGGLEDDKNKKTMNINISIDKIIEM